MKLREPDVIVFIGLLMAVFGFAWLAWIAAPFIQVTV